MADKKDELAVVNTQELGDAIGRAVAEGIAASSPRKVTIGQFVAKGPFSPAGIKLKAKLRRETWQNGSRCSAETLHGEEINLLNRITHGGRYIDRKVEVIIENEGSTDNEVVHIRFNNKKDAYPELKAQCRDFKDMLRQVVEAQEAEDAEKEEMVVRKQERHFGRGKATVEAREKAGVE